MNITPLNLLLADDDIDDCIFFKDALEELPVSAKVITVNDGVQLMQLLSKNEVLPDGGLNCMWTSEGRYPALPCCLGMTLMLPSLSMRASSTSDTSVIP